MTQSPNVSTVTSADGTRIAYTQLGSGPPLVMVHCVGVDRASTPQPTLPEALAEHFTVVTYDRRGKGESPSEAPYAVEREIEDLAAVAGVLGGEVDVYGFSSGAVLSLLAAKGGAPIRRLALLEPPLMPESRDEEKARLQELMATDRAAARRYFDTQIVGVPEEILDQMPVTDRGLANAPSILHEMEFLPGTSAETFRGLETPTLLMRSDHTAPEMAVWAGELVETMPHARAVELPGQWHGVDDATLVTAIRDFLVG